MSLEIPSGSITVMKVNTTPTGWTKTNSHNLSVFRVVTGSASNGGSVNYSSVFVQHSTTTTSVAGQAGGVSLTAPQLPTHTHRIGGISTTSNMRIPAPGLAVQQNSVDGPVFSGNVGSSSAHSHSASVTSGSFTPGTNIDLRVKYVDCILVQRS